MNKFFYRTFWLPALLTLLMFVDFGSPVQDIAFLLSGISGVILTVIGILVLRDEVKASRRIIGTTTCTAVAAAPLIIFGQIFYYSLIMIFGN